MNNYVKLGIFTILSLAAIIFSIVMVSNFTLSKEKKIYVYMDNASGLTKQTRVAIAGVQVGFLAKTSLDNDKAKLTLSIVDKDVKIYKNATASIVATGIIGSKYIAIDPGDSSYAPIENGDTIAYREADAINNILDKLSKALDSKEMGFMFENLAYAVHNLKEVSQNLKGQNGQINSIINNMNVFAANLAQISSENKDDLKTAIANFKDISSKLDLILAQVYKGEGLAGVLLNDKETGENLKEAVASAKDTMLSLQATLGSLRSLEMQWVYEGKYNPSNSAFVNDLGIKIIPNDNKFYYIGIANVSGNSDMSDEEKKEKRTNTLDALIGFRQDKFEVYAGVMKSQGGIGFGYSFFEPIYSAKKTMQFRLNTYDFGRKKGPMLDVDIRAGILKWLYAGLIVEDTIQKASFMPYIRLEITDRDLASLLGIAGLASQASK
jgi:phospholipid/cholesterol/gamma-HCH transport system substrate-binding protein